MKKSPFHRICTIEKKQAKNGKWYAEGISDIGIELHKGHKLQIHTNADTGVSTLSVVTTKPEFLDKIAFGLRPEVKNYALDIEGAGCE